MKNRQEYEIHSAREIPWKMCKKSKRIVIKLGTRALINEDRSFDEDLFKNLSEDVNKLMHEGKEIILVSSGAVNAGVNALSLPERPREVILQQVMAAVGNPLLIQQYQKYFTFSNIAQVLVTQEAFSNRISYNNFRDTMTEMLKSRVIPIINENDVVSTNELLSKDGTEYNFSDNDILAGLVAASMDADLLLLLSDIDGLYTKHPNSEFAEFIPYVPEITEEVLSMGKSGSKMGRGGMSSKISAAQIMSNAGGAAIIAHAKTSRVKDILAGKSKCTFFSPNQKLKNKKIWLIFGANLCGNLQVDRGAQKALLNGASLLFNGILGMKGDFNKGDIVSIVMVNDQNDDSEMFARGRVNFSAEELRRFSKIPKKMRADYFLQNNVKEIISHENMAFTDF